MCLEPASGNSTAKPGILSTQMGGSVNVCTNSKGRQFYRAATEQVHAPTTCHAVEGGKDRHKVWPDFGDLQKTTRDSRLV